MRAFAVTNAASGHRAVLGFAGLGVALGFLGVSAARGQSAFETLHHPDGQRVEGQIAGDARSGFRFVSHVGSSALNLEPGSIVHHGGSGPSLAASLPPFHFLVGTAARLSGSLRELTAASVRLIPAWQHGDVTLPRGCVQAIVQRPGEARILVDGFETLDRSRWTISGTPESVGDLHLSGARSVRLPARGARLNHVLDEPLAAGRFDVAFFDDASVVAGCQCVIEPTFRSPGGPSVMRIILGWSEESLAVESPSGLAVQRLARTVGWHRLSLRFGPDQTEIAVDGKELAHGKGPGGPLFAVALVTVPPPGGLANEALAAHFDDLQIIRFAQPPASLEIDPTQDEVRLAVGDQLYGTIPRADSDMVVAAIDGKSIALRWSEVSGLYFRRAPCQSSPVDGLLVRAEWRSAAGDRPADLDFAEGALEAQTDRSVVLSTPYFGTLMIPRDHLRRLIVLGRGRRVVIDPGAHHLGDEISVTPPLLDPPQDEGLTLDRTIEIADLPYRAAELVLDVVQVVSENGDSEHSKQVRAGELRTYVAINGRRIDYLNRHVKSRNETPERIRIPIPAGSLHAGRNALRIEVTGDSSPRVQYDDLGILQIALEFPLSSVVSRP
jgi:hypothetical protein